MKKVTKIGSVFSLVCVLASPIVANAATTNGVYWHSDTSISSSRIWARAENKGGGVTNVHSLARDLATNGLIASDDGTTWSEINIARPIRTGEVYNMASFNYGSSAYVDASTWRSW